MALISLPLIECPFWPILTYIVFPFVSSIYAYYFFRNFRYSSNLIVIILSARSNFEHRQAIRDTWISDLSLFDGVSYFFAIGNECSIPPLDRIDSTSCEEWNISIQEKDVNDRWFCASSLEQNKNKEAFPEQSSWYNGFGFKVLHSVQLLSIGCHVKMLSNHKSLSIILKDAEEIFLKVNVSVGICSFIEGGFCYVNLGINSLSLPKGFEGELFIEDQHVFQPFVNCIWENGSSIIFTFGRNGKIITKICKENCPLVSAYFQRQDIKSLQDHITQKPQRRFQWETEQNLIRKKIEGEIIAYNDIVLLSNLIDVYRNIPEKVIGIFEWVEDNYQTQFLLKVDDDTYVNVRKFQVIASSYNQSFKTQYAESLIMWSHFHYHQSVPTFGKWADLDYQSITYPPFPSGAGYLLTGSLLHLISKMATNLKLYQGEDITIGIWGETLVDVGQDGKILPVSKEEVECWLPSDKCRSSYLIPQLQPHQLRKFHKKLKET